MTEAAQPWLDYRLRGVARTANPGKHAGDRHGVGGAFRGLVPFWQLPDARRLDIRRSLMDPTLMPMVRQTDQHTTLTLMVAVDMSASMAARADRLGLNAAHAIASAAARSALRAGDRFGLVGFDTAIRPDLMLAPTRSRGGVTAGLAALAAARAVPCLPTGLMLLAAALPRARCLVLLLSDFAMPLRLLEDALPALHRHDVVPVQVHTDGPASLPAHGLARVQDAEGGAARLVLLRPKLRRQWLANEARHQAALRALFARHGRSVFRCGPTPDLVALSEHLVAA